MLKFTDSGLRPEIIKAIEEIGFDSATPVQEKTLPALLESKGDLVALAQTGTGKTAAFGLPIAQLADVNDKKVQSLILCPTRELCVQIAKDLTQYTKYINKFSVVAVYGGASLEPQVKALKRGCQVVVGTPGRVLDLIGRNVLKLANVRWMVLDEADEMLNMGFKEDLDAILEQTPPERQTLLFSATMKKEVSNIAKKYMNNPEEISIGKRNAGAENVSHEYYMVHSRDRYLALKRIVDINPAIYGIVFCRTRQETKDVAKKLMTDGYNADALHGDLSQSQRDYAMERFRLRNIQLLVATDVAARGLDVQDLTHIINYNLPDDLEAYVHRSGRTGRAGKNGVSIAIIHTREGYKVRDLERMTRKTFEFKKVPSGKDICEKQLLNLIDKVEKAEVDSRIDEFLPSIYEKLESLSREDLIKQFVSEEFNRFLTYYKNAQDINVNPKDDRNARRGRDQERGGRRDRGDRNERGARGERNERGPRGDRNSTNYSRFFINLGTNSGLDAGGIISLVNQNTRGERVEIGKIDIMKKFSFFEIDKKSEALILNTMNKTNFKGIPVAVQLSKPDTKEKGQDSDFARKRKSRAKANAPGGRRRRQD